MELCLLFRRVDRARLRRVRMERRLEERRQKSEDRIAMEADAPMLTPTSACVSATISLICYFLYSSCQPVNDQKEGERGATHPIPNKHDFYSVTNLSSAPKPIPL